VKETPSDVSLTRRDARPSSESSTNQPRLVTNWRLQPANSLCGRYGGGGRPTVTPIGVGVDLRFSGVVNFNLHPNIEDLIRAVPEDDLFEGNIEMMCRSLILTCHGAGVRAWRVKEISRLEHELLEASGNLKQAMVANTTYEKKAV